MPFIAAAGILGGSSVIGSVASGLIGSSASEKAAKQVAAAQQQGLQFQENVFGQEQNNLSPYIGTGQNALYSLASLYGLPGANGAPPSGNGAANAFQNFTQTPAYQFPLQQGELAANRGLAAQGLTGSGAQAKALTQYGQGYASQGFTNYISQLASLAGLGQSSATALGSAGNAASNNVLASLTNSGNAAAAGTLGAANATNNAIGSGLGALGNFLSNQNVLASLSANNSASSFGNIAPSNSPLAQQLISSGG